MSTGSGRPMMIMVLGAIQALKEAGLAAGKVLVSGCDGIPEMFAAIKSGSQAKRQRGNNENPLTTCLSSAGSRPYRARPSLNKTTAAPPGVQTSKTIVALVEKA
jgi:hypothetical protein